MLKLFCTVTRAYATYAEVLCITDTSTANFDVVMVH